MLKEREVLEQKIVITVNNYKHKKDVVENVKNKMFEKGFLKGNTQKLFNEPELIKDESREVLYLFTQFLFEETKEEDINPKKYFTSVEVKKMHNKTIEYNKENKIDFPLVFENVLQNSEESYITIVDAKMLKDLFDSNLIEYNYETQRSPKFKHDNKSDTIIEVPDLNSKSVRDIKQKLLNYEYLPDLLTLNVLLGSSEEEELEYIPREQKLIIHESEIDILDGFHRLNAIVEALEENPSLDYKFPVAIKNYDIETARKYFGQINTINPVDKVKLQSLKVERYSDYVVRMLMRKSDLRGRISESSYLSKLGNHLVSFGVLADEIDKQFKIESKKDAVDIADYLADFFDYLIGTFKEEFITKIEETRKTSIINHNNMFVGYVVLAKRFQDNGIKIRKIEELLKNVDFSRKNKMWVELGVLNEKGYMDRRTMKIRSAIRRFFNEMNLSKYK